MQASKKTNLLFFWKTLANMVPPRLERVRQVIKWNLNGPQKDQQNSTARDKSR